MGFIYQILNTVNNKRYIGRTINWRGRKSNHKGSLRKNKHHSAHLQHAWNKYGEDSFLFEVIEECENHKLPEREGYWITFYSSTSAEYGYNIDKVTTRGEVERSFRTRLKLGGEPYILYKHSTQEELEFPIKSLVKEYLGVHLKNTKIIRNHAGRYIVCAKSAWNEQIKKDFIKYINTPLNNGGISVYVFDKSTCKLLKQFKSIAEAARKLSMKEEHIRMCLRSKRTISRNSYLFSREPKCPVLVRKYKIIFKGCRLKKFRYRLICPDESMVYLYQAKDSGVFIPNATKKGLRKFTSGEKASYYGYKIEKLKPGGGISTPTDNRG